MNALTPSLSSSVANPAVKPVRRIVDYGFSLIELVVTVLIIGIIVAIAIPFFLNAQDSARQAAVESAARDGQVMARAAIIDGSSPHGGDLSVLETDDVVLSLANNFVIGDESTVCIRADWIGTGEATNYAVSGPCAESDTTVPIVDREEDDPLYTQLTYQCPTTREGYLGVVNVDEETRVQMWEQNDRDATIREIFYDAPPAGFDLRHHTRKEILRTERAEAHGVPAANDYIDSIIEQAADNDTDIADVPEYSTENTIKNTSELIEMEGGVYYTVRFDGEIETFTDPGHRGSEQTNEGLADCLVRIDHFGDDINLKNIVYLGGANLSYVPESIPSSVVALRGAFENATHFNHPNIKTWDVSNVHTLRSMFYNTRDFNQDLNGWDTSNVVYMNTTFRAAQGFTQDLDGWDTSKVESMQRMFGRAERFNGDITGWDTSNVKNMQAMFDEARSFNRDLSGWDVSSVEDHGIFNRESALTEENLPGFED